MGEENNSWNFSVNVVFDLDNIKDVLLKFDGIEYEIDKKKLGNFLKQFGKALK